MDGLLKAKERLFANPLDFSAGAIVQRGGYRQEIGYKSLKAHTLRSHTLSARTMIA